MNDYLTSNLSPICPSRDSVIYFWYDEEYTKKIKARKKKEVERETTAQKIMELFGEDAKISHTENGAPRIENTPYQNVSISHSKGWYAIYFSQDKVGIDIQLFEKNKLVQGQDYFVNEKEKKNEHLNRKLSIVWCTKEAIHKKYEKTLKNLKDDVTIVKVNDSNNRVCAELKGERIKSQFLIMSDVVLVWTVDKRNSVVP